MKSLFQDAVNSMIREMIQREETVIIDGDVFTGPKDGVKVCDKPNFKTAGYRRVFDSSQELGVK